MSTITFHLEVDKELTRLIARAAAEAVRGELRERLDHIDNQLKLILKKENKLMSQGTDLLAAVQSVQDSNTSQEARIDAIIALLESNPDDPDVTQAIANLIALKGTQDSYRPDPEPDPEA